MMNQYVSAGQVLKLLVHGFNQAERQMLDAVVKLSQRRQPRIELVGEDDGATADVVLIDAAGPGSRKWAEGQPWLSGKVVLWVDGIKGEDRNILKRPVQWSTLPAALTRVLSQTAPQAATATPVPAPAKTSAPAIGGGASVLVVDDSLAVRSLLRSLLQTQGLKVTDVDNAEAAIKLASQNHYDCVLLDVLMPGMDGYEACRKIKALGHGSVKPEIIMLTSKSSPFDKIRGKMAGCDAYLTKPIDPDRLTEVIMGRIAKPGAADGEDPLHPASLQLNN
jgi:two-component system cell cycle response regulator